VQSLESLQDRNAGQRLRVARWNPAKAHFQDHEQAFLRALLWTFQKTLLTELFCECHGGGSENCGILRQPPRFEGLSVTIGAEHMPEKTFRSLATHGREWVAVPAFDAQQLTNRLGL
jgi:hypothetical protein